MVIEILLHHGNDQKYILHNDLQLFDFDIPNKLHQQSGHVLMFPVIQCDSYFLHYYLLYVQHINRYDHDNNQNMLRIHHYFLDHQRKEVYIVHIDFQSYYYDILSKHLNDLDFDNLNDHYIDIQYYS